MTLLQCIQGLPEGALRRIILTASGGAFRYGYKFIFDMFVSIFFQHSVSRCNRNIEV